MSARWFSLCVLLTIVSLASAVALSTGVLVSVGDVSAVALSTAVAFVVAVLAGATGMAIGAITDSLMMSSSAASVFRGGGAGPIRTDITVTTIIPTVTTTTHTVTLDTVSMVIMVTAVTDAIIRAEITRAVVRLTRVACTTNMHHIING